MPAIITNNESSNLSPIQKFYSGTSIFITGGTGFLGKVLIEKLLRTCPDLHMIHLLIRDKRGMTGRQRVDKLFENPLFDTIKQENPNFKRKITVVNGDCSVAGLGLNSKSRQMLLHHVNIVFHVAATIRFDEHLRTAMNINVKGTHAILDLCKKMLQLKSFVYVSTAYSNCYLTKIEEKFYDIPYNYDELNNLIDKLDDNTIEELTPKILGKWPNTYTMTKAIAESLIRNNNVVPCGVFRPGIIVSAAEEPISGWTDNFYNITGVTAAVYVGIGRSMFLEEHYNADLVPVDMSVHALISCAKEVADKWEKTSTPPIYNYVSSTDNPLTWGELVFIVKMYVATFPVLRAIWPSDFMTFKSVYINDLFMLLILFPAAIMDILRLIFCFRRPILFKMVYKMRSSLWMFQKFCTNEFQFTNDNVKGLHASMDWRDKDLFKFDITSLNWLNYLKNYIFGVRRFLIKEDYSTIPEARRLQTKLQIAWYGVIIVLGYVLLSYFFKLMYSLGGCLASTMGF